ncbi:MAG: TonB family protein, partial [Bacteroidales bacterium]|nr:TonB family protein [Bacteroidales bacterium]
NKFVEWVYNNVEYPQECIADDSAGGVVVARFVIDEEGKVVKPVVSGGSSHNECFKREVLKTILQSPKWTPGEIDGKPVKVSYAVPVMFHSITAKFLEDANKAGVSAFNGQLTPAKFTIGTSSPVYTENFYNNFKFWVFQNLTYPEIAKKEGLQGTVYVSFVVDKNGKVTNVKVIRGCHESLDKEAVRVISSSPDWVPAKIGNINVPVTYTFSVIFQLR